MATLDEMYSALRNADAAGAADDARMIADRIAEMQQKPKASGSFLPISKGQDGKISFDSNAGILGSIKSAFTLPGDVAGGRAQLPSSGAVPGSVEFGDPNSAGLRVADLATMGSPVNPGVRAGDQLIPGLAKSLKPAKPAVPTTQELMDTAAGDFRKFEKSGMQIPPEAFSEFARRAKQNLYDNGGISETDAGATFAKLARVENGQPGAVAVTAPNIKSFRENLGHTAQNFNPNFAKDQLAASRVIKNLDDFVRASDAPRNVVGTPAIEGKAGPWERPSQIYDRARGNAAAAYRSNDINGELDKAYTGTLERALLDAQVQNSGRNIDNKIRQNIAATLKKEKEISGLIEPEIAALKSSADGGKVRNVARYIGNFYGGGGGLGQHVATGFGAAGGALAGSPAGPAGMGVGAALGAMVPAAIGSGAKSLSNSLAKRSLSKVDEMLRKRSPEYERRVANPQMVPQNPEARAALIRALMLQQQQ